MDAAEQKFSPPILRYEYRHKATEGSTGYFRCELKNLESLDSLLQKLYERPLDSFLHEEALWTIGDLGDEELSKLAERSLQENLENKNFRRLIACLLLECAVLRPLSKKILAKKITDLCRLLGAWQTYTPFPHILTYGLNGDKMQEDYNRTFAIAINDLSETYPDLENLIPADAINSLAEISTEFAKSQGLLPKLHSEFSLKLESSPRLSATDLILLAKERLDRAGLLYGPEMRHEASLSPIALLRQWRVKSKAANGRNFHHLEGLSTAYGRGLSLAQARISCLMEIVERASAYPSIASGGKFNAGEISNLLEPLSLLRASVKELRESSYKFFIPAQSYKGLGEDLQLHWVEGKSPQGEAKLVPAQSVFLFLNLDEPSLYEHAASTGLASGQTMAEAKLAALTEILERDAHATTLFERQRCFIPLSRDDLWRSLFEDYRYKRIHLFIEDISNEAGFPVYRCIVRDAKAKVHFATGAGLNAQKAVFSALTECPWPYSMSSPFPSTQASLPVPHNIPGRIIENLPNYSFGDPEMDLRLVEKMLEAQNLKPVYVNISRADLQFPVVRAFIPKMETCCEYDEFLAPGPRFHARNFHLRKRRIC